MQPTREWPQAGRAGDLRQDFRAGGHSFTWIIEGSEVYTVDGQPARTVKAGDLLHEEPMQMHTTENQSPVKLLVLRVVEKASPRRCESLSEVEQGDFENDAPDGGRACRHLLEIGEYAVRVPR